MHVVLGRGERGRQGDSELTKGGRGGDSSAPCLECPLVLQHGGHGNALTNGSIKQGWHLHPRERMSKCGRRGQQAEFLLWREIGKGPGLEGNRGSRNLGGVGLFIGWKMEGLDLGGGSVRRFPRPRQGVRSLDVGR